MEGVIGSTHVAAVASFAVLNVATLETAHAVRGRERFHSVKAVVALQAL